MVRNPRAEGDGDVEIAVDPVLVAIAAMKPITMPMSRSRAMMRSGSVGPETMRTTTRTSDTDRRTSARVAE